MQGNNETITHALLAAYLNGSDIAAARFFDRIKEDLLRRLSQHRLWPSLRGKVQPEDVVQELFLRALSSGLLKKIEDRGRGSAMRILGGILDCVLIDDLRRMGALKRGDRRLIRQLSESTLIEDGLDGLPNGGTSASERVCAKEIVDVAKQLLTPKDLEVWSLVNVRGEDRDAVARRLGKSASAVARTLRRAKAILAATFRAATGKKKKP
mgnify:CR=1 FL=1